MKEETGKKVEQAIRLIESLTKGRKVEIAYSGGKDSDVLLWIAKQVPNIDFTAVYKSTTIDPPGTIAHVMKNNVNILRPRYSFLQLIEKKGLPSMYRRFCCSYLKEYYTSPLVMTGVRTAESIKRAKRYVEPSSCRYYGKNKYSEIITPIYNFTNEDIFEIVTHENISCHPLYYDNGVFQVKRRLGCVGCPLQADRGKSDYKLYPKLLKQVAKRLQKYLLLHDKEDITFKILTKQLFYSNHGKEKWQQCCCGLFEEPNYKRILENYFNIDMTL